MKTVKPVKTSNSQQTANNNSNSSSTELNKSKVKTNISSNKVEETVTKQEQQRSSADLSTIKKDLQETTDSDSTKTIKTGGAKEGIMDQQSLVALPHPSAGSSAANTTADQIQYSADGRPKLIVSIELDIIKLISMNPNLALSESSYYDQLSELHGSNTALQVAAHHAAASNESLLNDIVNDELKMNSKSSGGKASAKEAAKEANVVPASESQTAESQQEKKSSSSSTRSKSPSSSALVPSSKSSSTATSKDRVRKINFI